MQLRVGDNFEIAGHSDKNQSGHMSEALTIAINDFLPRVKFTGDAGAYPEGNRKGRKALHLGTVIGGLAMDDFLNHDDYKEQFADIRQRWKEDKEFRRLVSEYVSCFFLSGL